MGEKWSEALTLERAGGGRAGGERSVPLGKCRAGGICVSGLVALKVLIAAGDAGSLLFGYFQ